MCHKWPFWRCSCTTLARFGAFHTPRHEYTRGWSACRSSAEDGALSLAQHISQPEALTEAVATAQRALQGTLDGKLKQSSEKLGTLAVVSALATAKARGSDLEATAAQATDFLVDYYKEEINEEVCTQIVCALKAAFAPALSSTCRHL